MTAFREPAHIEDDIDFLNETIEKAEQYTQDIFDVVRLVGQVQMLDHNRAFINACKNKIKTLREDLKESRAYYSEDDDE